MAVWSALVWVYNYLTGQKPPTKTAVSVSATSGCPFSASAAAADVKPQEAPEVVSDKKTD